MPDHSPSGMTQTATGDLNATSSPVFDTNLASAAYLVLEISTLPPTAGLQNDSAGGTRLFGFGWLILGMAEFGAYRELFVGSGTRFPCIIDLTEVHLDFMASRINNGYQLTWRTLA